MYFVFTLDVDVYDVDQLYATALKHATEKDGLSAAEANELLTNGPDNAIDIAACLVMLFDPGPGPAGIEIMQSSAEAC